ncbi:ComF family protein [Oceanobacillus chungangensis]|uniref:ComF family protein n=2 Tax=Oceanobacillus chungangensis TaxID=1229152 RepID=A0A3D8PKG5_9BACI|nr:ComF family protein [Oceanobacillus chungangensis]
MECLWCAKTIILDITWMNLFMPEKPKPLCRECVEQLDQLDGERCKLCSRRSEIEFCLDCIQWNKHATKKTIELNYSIFAYNPFIQAIITKWKYRGDYVLGNIFQSYFQQTFKDTFAFLKKDAIIIPIPLSEERLLERGFNQAKRLAEFLPMETKEILTRIHGEKQSKKTRAERLDSKNPFFMKEKLQKPVVLVDDIYTTGTTLRHAASLLRDNGCPKVYAFTLIRG